jgi:hypothetical protein
VKDFSTIITAFMKMFGFTVDCDCPLYNSIRYSIYFLFPHIHCIDEGHLFLHDAFIVMPCDS